jgi:hypothetical protein
MPPKKAAAAAMKKPRMVVPKVKPPGMSDEYWAKELARRAIVIMDRNKRRAIQRQQDAEVAKAASFASYATSQGESNNDLSAVVAQSGTDSGILCSPRLPRPACPQNSGRARRTHAPSTVASACSRR